MAAFLILLRMGADTRAWKTVMTMGTGQPENRKCMHDGDEELGWGLFVTGLHTLSHIHFHIVLSVYIQPNLATIGMLRVNNRRTCAR